MILAATTVTPEIDVDMIWSATLVAITLIVIMLAFVALIHEHENDPLDDAEFPTYTDHDYRDYDAAE